MKWIKIDKDNRPQFDKYYLLGIEKKGFLRPEKIFAGTLNQIEITETEETLIFKVDVFVTISSRYYKFRTGITHFIEIDNLPKIN